MNSGIFKIYPNSSHDIHVIRHVNVSNLPIEYDVQNVRFVGWLFITAALAGLIATALMMSGVIERSGINLDTYSVFLFIVIGFALLISGVYIVTLKEQISLDQHTITISKKTIFDHESWTEPLNKYFGVWARKEYHSGGRRHPSYTLHIIELYHEDVEKRIKLYVAKHDKHFRQLFEEYSRQLKLPALEGEEGQFVKRDASDLDKSVRELVAEGKLKVDFDPSRRPPKGITAEMKDQRLCINLPAAPLHLGGMFGAFIGRDRSACLSSPRQTGCTVSSGQITCSCPVSIVYY